MLNSGSPERQCRQLQCEKTLEGVYFATIVGAAVYFLQHAGSFWGGVLGILKAFVWPAFAVYKVLELLNL